MTKRTKKGFSMVELLLLLLFVSLITAALTPVVTKKHYKMPRPANHGAYICYDKGNGKLHEVRYSGKALNTTVFDRDVTQCLFEPPQKVSYFHVSAIGGGGGGGDSGYNGGAFTTMGPYTERLSPIGITEYMVSPAQRGITEKDFNNYGGNLFGFVVGASSGKGGDQLYVNRHDSTPCVRQHTETYTNTETTVYTKTTCSSWSTVTVETPTSNDSSSSQTSGSGGSDSDWSSGDSESSHSKGDTPDSPSAPPPKGHTISSGDGGKWVNVKPNGSMTETGSQQNSHKGGLNLGIPSFKPGSNHFGHESYNLKDKKLKIDLPKFRFYDPNEQRATFCPKSKYAFLFSTNDLLAYEYQKCNSYSTTSWTESYVSVSHKTICEKYRDYYSYSTSKYTGAPGAGGATCRSNIKQGKVGLQYSVVSVPASGSDGYNCYPGYNLSPEYDSPHYGSTECTGNCATSGNTAGTPYSTITFGGGKNQTVDTVSAENARTGGSPATCSGNGSTSGIAGTTCNISATTDPCVTGRYGYCLQRWNSSSYEANTTYSFQFTFSQNYLQYGLAGIQGEYKTMVIRSFKDQNVPITIGLGGAKGVNGGKGGDGQATSLGNIITAKGGEGGEGGQLTTPELLEGYRTGAESLPAGEINKGYMDGTRIVRQEGGVEPEKPKPNNLSSNIMNFLAPQDSEKIAEIMETYRIGYGGKGGGSRHNCWFGEYRKWLDGNTSCSHQTSQPNSCGELELSYPTPPAACRDKWERIDAQDGKSGAVIIRW